MVSLTMQFMRICVRLVLIFYWPPYKRVALFWLLDWEKLGDRDCPTGNVVDLELQEIINIRL